MIHGWSQSDLCWAKQVGGGLANRLRIVTFDLRGHGLSEKPTGPEQYADGQLWADDLAAVIEQTGLERPVLVAWSYGGSSSPTSSGLMATRASRLSTWSARP
jgi:pimeloyl-ACP methyl ester carboxylesterase